MMTTRSLSTDVNSGIIPVSVVEAHRSIGLHVEGGMGKAIVLLNKEEVRLMSSEIVEIALAVEQRFGR